MAKTIVALPAILLACSCAAPGDAPAEARTAERSWITLRVGPLTELWFQVRAQAAQAGRAPLPGHEEAVEAARRVQELLGSFGGWGPLDAQVFTSAGPADLRAGFAALPDPYVRRGREIHLRDAAVRLATAVQELMPHFLAQEWSARRERLEEWAAVLEADFLSRHQEALSHAMEALGIADPGVEVPMILVTEANPPGAMTYRLPGGRSASVIGVEGFEESGSLQETILHEAVHALDAASREKGSVLEDLRALLRERGWTPRDRLFHDLPHALIFVQAEETVRRVLDPEHVGYGVTSGAYQRMGGTAEAVRETWPRHLDGALDRAEALRRIVEHAATGSAPR